LNHHKAAGSLYCHENAGRSFEVVLDHCKESSTKFQ
jgi:hypothetical protein